MPSPVHLACGKCKSIRTFSGTPLACEVCGWVCPTALQQALFSAEKTTNPTKQEGQTKAPSKRGGGIIVWLVVFLGFYLFNHFDGMGELQRLYYRIFYGKDSSTVVIDREPHDCDFLKAPIGDKYCHFDKEVVYDKQSDTVYVGYTKITE